MERPTEDGVRTYICPTFGTFLDLVDERYMSSNGLIWRGHAETSWVLEPTIIRAARRKKSAYIKPLPNSIVDPHLVSWDGARAFSSVVETLQSFGAEYAILDDETAMAYAQHHGMLTKYLDWTRSPYVACFFAFADALLNPIQRPSKDIVVWGLSTNALVGNMLGIDERDRDPRFSYEFVDRPHFLNKRHYAQQGGMTFVWPPLDIESLVRYRRKGVSDGLPWLRRILIPKKEMESSLIHLNRMNVNYRTLYPDTLGACLHANLNFFMARYEGINGGHVPRGYEGN